MAEVSQNLERELTELIAQVSGREPADLKPGANLWTDIGIDSIKAIEITVAIERKYAVRIRDEQIPRITTILQGVEVLKEALSKKSAKA
jgi:acyl carrier protein